MKPERKLAMKFDLYNTSYDHHAAEVQQEVRRETHGEDIGQTGWMTTEEFCFSCANSLLTPIRAF